MNLPLAALLNNRQTTQQTLAYRPTDITSWTQLFVNSTEMSTALCITFTCRPTFFHIPVLNKIHCIVRFWLHASRITVDWQNRNRISSPSRLPLVPFSGYFSLSHKIYDRVHFFFVLFYTGVTVRVLSHRSCHTTTLMIMTTILGLVSEELFFLGFKHQLKIQNRTKNQFEH
jgi:hypothetical protein